MKKYKIEIQIGYRKYNHSESAETEFDARTKTIELASIKFGVTRNEVKINSCTIVGENKNSDDVLGFLKNTFKFK